MTRWTEADPTPEQPWRETSQRGVRLMALQATAAAVRRAQEKPAEKAGQA